jgi:hypothetical protein
MYSIARELWNFNYVVFTGFFFGLNNMEGHAKVALRYKSRSIQCWGDFFLKCFTEILQL